MPTTSPVMATGGTGAYGSPAILDTAPPKPTPTAPPATLNANISTVAPRNMGTPAVITSDAAAKDYANVGNQLSQLHNDAQTQKVNQTPAPQTDSTGTTETPPEDIASTANDQVNSLLDNLSTQISSIGTDKTATGLNGESITPLDAITQDLSANQDQMNQQYQSAHDELSSIASGTYPLSPVEQQLLSSTISQFQAAISGQQQANQAFQGGLTATFASLGINMTAPTQAIGAIQMAITQGQQKIADLDAKMSSSVANLQQAFQKQDYSMVQSNWQDTSKFFSDRQTALQDMQKTIIAQQQQQRSDLMDWGKEQVQTIFNSADLTLKQRSDLADQFIKQASLSETIKKDAMDAAIQQETAMKGVYSIHDNPDGTQSIIDSRTGSVVGSPDNAVLTGQVAPGQTGIPLLDANTQVTSTGIPYIDGTNLTGKEASSAQLRAAQMGIPYLGKAGASAMQNITAAKQNLSSMMETASNLNPSSGFTRPFVSVGHALESWTQVGPGATDVGDYESYRQAAITAIKAIGGGSGSGFRINQAEISNMINSLPTYNDTADVSKGKMSVTQAMLDSNERAIIGEKAYDSYNPGWAATDLANLYNSNPTMKAQIDGLKSQGLAPQQIIQIVIP